MRQDATAGKRGITITGTCFIILLTAWVLTACVRQVHPLADEIYIPAGAGPPESGASPTNPPATLQVTEASPVAPTATLFLADPSLPRSQYTLAVSFDYSDHRLSVKQGINYINRSTEALPELLLVVEPNRNPGVFDLKSLRWDDDRPIQTHSLDGARLYVPLPEPLPPGRSVPFQLEYELLLPAEPSPFGYTERQSNLANWYPFVPPYMPGEGWLVHDPTRVAPGEHIIYPVADYDVSIGLVDPPPNLSIAASAPAVNSGSVYRYHVEAARNFTWSASTDYLRAVETVGTATVTSYFFPEHRTAGEAALQTTADALRLYTELFTPYLHSSLSVVEADFPDGLEFDGLYFLGKDYYATYFGGPQNFLTTLAAHETAHQWFYALVGNNQAIEPWLDEALATYAEALFFETYYPDLVDWWWTFRVSLYEPGGSVNSAIYDHADFRLYVNAVYLRGALFLEDLRELVGEEAFYHAVRDYLVRHSYSLGSRTDFFARLESATSADIRPLLEMYFTLEDVNSSQ